MVCERGCVLREGMHGFCKNYANIGGKLYAVGYGSISAIEPRPIEIKPFFHYYPNSWALTFSGWGCNFKCLWCQNYHLSMEAPAPGKGSYLEPRELVKKAQELGQHGLCASFNEPIVHADYLVDIGIEAHSSGLYLSMVTNGSMTLSVLKKLLEVGYTGFSIDIKGCRETYRRFIRIDPEAVYRNAKYILDSGGHVEMVYLVIPGVNDWGECYEWILEKHINILGPDIPLHVNRYYPAYRFSNPPTPTSKLLEIKSKAVEYGIEYVYIGNVPSEALQDTYCPKCGKLLIARRGYRVVYWSLSGNRCPRCSYKIRLYGEYKAN